MATSDEPRKKYAPYLTGAVVLVLSLIVLIALLTPPAPEKVVGDMLEGLAKQDLDAVEGTVTAELYTEMQIQVSQEQESVWPRLLTDGELLFTNYEIGDVTIEGSKAQVTVYFGPGLIQVQNFHLVKEGKHWLVSGLGE